jgi:alcohol dehydrogenase YqhD (iron-dependent ADH family)
MKQEFEMTEDELQAIYDISRDNTPVIFVGTWLGLDKQERANKLWQIMADNYGFVWDSVEPSSRGKKFFLATPKEKVIPKTQAEIEMDKYDTLQKIVDQLESCNYECEASMLKMNIAFLALKRMAKK